MKKLKNPMTDVQK